MIFVSTTRYEFYYIVPQGQKGSIMRTSYRITGAMGCMVIICKDGIVDQQLGVATVQGNGMCDGCFIGQTLVEVMEFYFVNDKATVITIVDA